MRLRPPALVLGLLIGAAVGALVSPSPQPQAAGVDYRLHIPGNASGALVILLPATGWTAEEYETESAALEFSGSTGTTVATVEEEAQRWDGGSCCLVPGDTTHRDDVTAVLAVLAAVQARTDVDPHRVYLAGGSAGGMMAWRVLCRRPDLFAGALVMAGSLMTSCGQTPARVVRLHGTADTSVPYDRAAPAWEGHIFPTPDFGIAARCPRCDIRVKLYEGWPHRWHPDAWTDAWPTLSGWTT